MRQRRCCAKRRRPGWELHARSNRSRYRDVLVRASAELNHRDWTQLPVTSDFVVLAAEQELVDAHENLRRAIPLEKHRQLEAGGWLR
jgi:hypothetical protein